MAVELQLRVFFATSDDAKESVSMYFTTKSACIFLELRYILHFKTCCSYYAPPDSFISCIALCSGSDGVRLLAAGIDGSVGVWQCK
jgi:hypothetical protein